MPNPNIYAVYVGPDPVLKGQMAMARTGKPRHILVQLDDTKRFPLLAHGWHEYPSEHWTRITARQKFVLNSVLESEVEKFGWKLITNWFVEHRENAEMHRIKVTSTVISLREKKLLVWKNAERRVLQRNPEIFGVPNPVSA